MNSVAKTTAVIAIASIGLLMSGVPSSLANSPSYGHTGYGHGSGAGHGYGKGLMHSGTGHLIRHLLKHEKDIGLTADQVAKLKEMQLNLDRVRIKAEADIQIAERELKALTDDEQSDLSAIQGKLKQSEDLQVGLRMAAIKMRREVMSVLTPEQREKEKSEHGKVMQQHKGEGGHHGGMMPYGAYPHGGSSTHGTNPHGANPHGKNPHDSAVSPAAPGNMAVE
ncbi:MAG: Spy/CpxP family protein refolding chaperone [Nitrospira sp.]